MAPLPPTLAGVMRRLHAPVYAMRIRELAKRIMPHLRPDGEVLDVGCGFGALGRAIMDAPDCPAGVRVVGLERSKRGNEQITVHAYDGRHIPFGDRAYDVVILADVLHHEPDAEHLLRDCIRVSRRLLIIKDHQRTGFLAQQRITLLDWGANAPYGVSCTHRYWTPEEWPTLFRRHQLSVVEEARSLRLYPWGLNAVFGGKLQRMAVLAVPQGQSGGV